MTYHVLYNPLSNNKRGENEARTELGSYYPNDNLVYSNVLDITDIPRFISELEPGAGIIIAGGDGTLNHFINDLGGNMPDMPVFYFATGSGNDFLNDIEKSKKDGPVCINEYMKNLPVITVNGMKRYFFNGIGYGLDGYCCEEGDKIRSTSDKPINYTSIAVKGLLYGYKRTTAHVTVDGKEFFYKNVWLAPCMKGRFFGGGMKCAPNQNRSDPRHTVTVMIMHSPSKLLSLAAFPSMIKGTHIKRKKIVSFAEGHNVTVEFDHPTALQIDGETVLNVSTYSVSTGF